MMTDKKIAVHVTNEEQWDEVGKIYGNDFSPEFRDIYRYGSHPIDDLVRYEDGYWGYVDSLNDGYELLEFNEWQARVKGDKMEKIEIPQAVYDEIDSITNDSIKPTFIHDVLFALSVQQLSYPKLFEYVYSSSNINKNHLNLAKVMAGESEFVPIEEAYYWQDKQEMWLRKSSTTKGDTISTCSMKLSASKLTETEIREKTSFDIDKLKKVSE